LEQSDSPSCILLLIDSLGSSRFSFVHSTFQKGTGKTSLCKALAQKMSVRLSHRYKNSVLVEINSHSLFSKWFSESGKLVMKLFGKIKELVDDENTFVCVLIDEVESLSAARKSSLSGRCDLN
jgi:pachytene checkpoint protein 2